MKRTFDKDGISIINGDCIKEIKSIDCESIDLILTSPPYCMNKAYEDLHDDIETFKKTNKSIIEECARVLKKGGSLCWQVGYHVKNSVIIPLDSIIYNIVEDINARLDVDSRLLLRNRIVWTFGHGLNSERRFSGRHETILWFTKGNSYVFNLDCVRVPQKYPGKTFFKGKKKGEISGNPLGKNPADVWDIPNVKANHVEKTDHPCQFPEALAQRLILALTNESDIVLDPFLGSGTTALACHLNNRRFVGFELEEKYFKIAVKRINDSINGEIRIREDVPVMVPDPKSKVAKKPDNFK